MNPEPLNAHLHKELIRECGTLMKRLKACGIKKCGSMGAVI